MMKLFNGHQIKAQQYQHYEAWMWNKGLSMHTAEVSFLRGACDVNGMDGESNESVYGGFVMFDER